MESSKEYCRKAFAFAVISRNEMAFPERSVADADRPLRCGLTASEPEMQLGLRDHGCANPVSWFPGRDAEPSPGLPAGGQPLTVTMGCSVSLSVAGWKRKALLKPAPSCLLAAFMAYPSGASEQRCQQPWRFLAGDTGEPS